MFDGITPNLTYIAWFVLHKFSDFFQKAIIYYLPSSQKLFLLFRLPPVCFQVLTPVPVFL